MPKYTIGFFEHLTVKITGPRERLRRTFWALEKWKHNRIDIDTCHLWKLGSREDTCPLCEKYNFGDCPDCPLSIIGEWCVCWESAYEKTYRSGDTSHLVAALKKATALAAALELADECAASVRGMLEKEL